MAPTFPYELNTDIIEYTTDPAVYRLNFGTRYFIFKGKFFKASVEQNLRDIWKLVRSPEQKLDHFFWPAVAHIKKARPARCIVDLISQTSDGIELLQVERNELARSKDDPNCLNTQFEPIVPKWIQEQIDGTAQSAEKPAPVKRREIKAKVELSTPREVKTPAKISSKASADQAPPSDRLSALMEAFGSIDE